MQSKTVKCVGVNYTISVPETAAEFDALAKREGACVEEAINNTIYRGTNADFRDAYLGALCEKYSYTRPTEPDKSGAKDAQGNPRLVFVNSEKKEIDIIIAANSIDEATQQAIADEVMGSVDDKGNPVVVFDPSQRERKPREVAIGKQDLADAKVIVADSEKLAKFVKNAKKKFDVVINITDDMDEEAKVKAVATGLKEARKAVSASLAA